MKQDADMDADLRRSHAGHETRDVDARRLVQLGIVLAVTILLSAAASAGVMAVWMTGRPSAGPIAPLTAASPAVPPMPRLQVTPRQDLAGKRAEEEAVLDGYGWVDRSAGVVRMPIERAMDLIVARSNPRQPGSVNGGVNHGQ